MAPITGQCACKELSFTIDAEPLTVVACHCPFCQRSTGGPFATIAAIPKSAIRFTAGKPKVWEHHTSSGRTVLRTSCPTCGSIVFNAGLEMPMGMVRTGTLDARNRLRPVGHFWTKNKMSWYEIPKGDLVYDAFPDSFEELIAAWKSRGAAQP